MYDFIVERKRNIFLFYLENFYQNFFLDFLSMKKFFIVKKLILNKKFTYRFIKHKFSIIFDVSLLVISC